MPTPIGHALAGLATAWLADAVGPIGRRTAGTATGGTAGGSRLAGVGGGIAVASAVLAAAPDMDIFVGSHRAFTHSVGALAVVGLLAGVLARRWRMPAIRTAVTCVAAYATHPLLDWLGTDTALPRGIMVLWPVSAAYYTSGVDLFLKISRTYRDVDEFVIGNLRSLAWELVVLLPVAAVAWWVRKRALAGRS